MRALVGLTLALWADVLMWGSRGLGWMARKAVR